MATSKDVGMDDKLVVGRPYRPAKDTMDDTRRTWDRVQAIMVKTPSGVTRKVLTATLKEEYNHGSFVGYAIRRGWLVPK